LNKLNWKKLHLNFIYLILLYLFISFNFQEFRKYWNQRYRLFSKLDEGILMDKEGWFSVTPEIIAKHIAERVVTYEDMLIVDAFCGVGGNTIQFALKGARVIAIDLDKIKLKCARRNAEIYGVRDQIYFLHMDFFDFVKWYCPRFRKMRQILCSNPVKRKTALSSVKDQWSNIGAVFLSPPWGGPSYSKRVVIQIFSLDNLVPNGFEIFYAARKLSKNIAYYLPRSTSTSEVSFVFFYLNLI
uniref:Trimethylguanosine synthase n=1 Tax=Dracunculus medinensis TaxID=318479 RepID=A0A0N4UKN0_DRAME